MVEIGLAETRDSQHRAAETDKPEDHKKRNFLTHEEQSHLLLRHKLLGNEAD